MKIVWPRLIVDRLFGSQDEIILRFNTKAEEGSPLVWRVFINDVEHLASGFEVHGYIHDVLTYEYDVKKYNVGCKGQVRWEGTKAVIITAKKAPRGAS